MSPRFPATRTSRILLAAFGLLIVAAVAWFAGSQVSHRPPAAANTAADPTDVRTDEDASGSPRPDDARATAAAPAPLPPPDAPFDTVVGELLARAEAGEAGAACRLSLELLRCAQVLQFGRYEAASNLEEAIQAEGVGDRRDAEYLLAQSDHLTALGERCRTIDADLVDRAPEFLRDAALAGDREARLQYVDGRNLFPPHDYSYIADPYFDRWRREAPRLLADLLEEGEPQAAIWMAEGRGGGEGAIQGLLRDDVARAQVWIAVVDQLYDDMTLVPVPVEPPSDERLPAVAATSARWRERWYGDRTFRFFERPVFDLLPTANPNAVNVGGGCGRTTPRGAAAEVAR